ncbi:MAG: nuclear transport factor 2 family protein [Novosphingobium sp.]
MTASAPDDNEALVLRFIAAMSANDAEGAAMCLGPDAFTLAKGFSRFTGKRQYETIVGTINAFREIVPSGLRLEVGSVTAADERVVVEAEGNALTSAGKPYCNQYCFVFTVRDGLIRQVNEYFCTRLAEEVLWPLVEAAGAGAGAD